MALFTEVERVGVSGRCSGLGWYGVGAGLDDVREMRCGSLSDLPKTPRNPHATEKRRETTNNREQRNCCHPRISRETLGQGEAPISFDKAGVTRRVTAALVCARQSR